MEQFVLTDAQWATHSAISVDGFGSDLDDERLPLLAVMNEVKHVARVPADPVQSGDN